MMTTKERAAMQQALEALKRWRDWDDSNNTAAWGLDDEDAITALREALAEQAEQEPVAEILVNDKDVIVLWHKTARQLGHQAKLYAAPVRTKDLTAEEIHEVRNKYHGNGYSGFARAVIAADREKNK